MTTRPSASTLKSMAHHPHPDEQPLRVVVAGAGVGGLETMVALRSLVGHRVALTLVAWQDDFTVHALEVFEPFGLGVAQRYPVAALAADLDAVFRHDAVARVERDDRTVHLVSGDELVYDRLVLAVGAFPYPAYEHGVCFKPAHDAEAFDAVVDDLRSGRAERIAIVVPPGCTWTLPAYELALMVAALATPRQVTLVTSEPEPLGAFGAPASEWVRTALRAAGVALLAGVRATVPHPTTVGLSPGASLACDRVVHLPLLSGPNCPGVPCDSDGFVLIDDAFRVCDDDDVFAVGDATAGAYKQGGLAAQQADVVAEHIAWQAGAEHPPRPYRPVLRGLLRTVDGPRYLRAEPPGEPTSAEVSDECLWWPASKVTARWLTPWLAARDVQRRPPPTVRKLPTGGISSAHTR
jgi:sulfide:quinone oxidoreductase